MDMEFGPNGALYVLEYGDGYFAENPDAGPSWIHFVGVGGNRSPVPKITADPGDRCSTPHRPLLQRGHHRPRGRPAAVRVGLRLRRQDRLAREEPGLDLRGGRRVPRQPRVTDDGGRHRGRFANADVTVVVGNEVPTVSFVTPLTGQTFSFGDAVPFEVAVTDDQPVDCSRVTVTYVLGHDEHGHPQTTASGCSGTIATTFPGGHDPGEDELRGVFVANYTDDGGDAGVPLTGTAEVVLDPTA